MRTNARSLLRSRARGIGRVSNVERASHVVEPDAEERNLATQRRRTPRGIPTVQLVYYL